MRAAFATFLSISAWLSPAILSGKAMFLPTVMCG